MSQQKNIKPMPDIAFRMMVWAMSLMDIFRKPENKLRKVPFIRGMTVVDYACGPGRYTIPAAKIVGPTGKVYAIDSQHLAIEIVKKKSAKQSLNNIQPVLVDSFNTGIPDQNADIVLLIDALTPIGEHESLFHEIHRLLKPGGILFMDSSHMSPTKARRIVEGTGLFTVTKADGKDFQLVKK